MHLGHSSVRICRQLFGGNGGQVRVLEELQGYSDYKLHSFALQNGLTKFQLAEDAVLGSGKCRLLVELLADLKASQHPAASIYQVPACLTEMHV